MYVAVTRGWQANKNSLHAPTKRRCRSAVSAFSDAVAATASAASCWSDVSGRQVTAASSADSSDASPLAACNLLIDLRPFRDRCCVQHTALSGAVGRRQPDASRRSGCRSVRRVIRGLRIGNKRKSALCGAGAAAQQTRIWWLPSADNHRQRYVISLIPRRLQRSKVCAIPRV